MAFHAGQCPQFSIHVAGDQPVNIHLHLNPPTNKRTHADFDADSESNLGMQQRFGITKQAHHSSGTWTSPVQISINGSVNVYAGPSGLVFGYPVDQGNQTRPLLSDPPSGAPMTYDNSDGEEYHSTTSSTVTQTTTDAISSEISDDSEEEDMDDKQTIDTVLYDPSITSDSEEDEEEGSVYTLRPDLSTFSNSDTGSYVPTSLGCSISNSNSSDESEMDNSSDSSSDSTDKQDDIQSLSDLSEATTTTSSSSNLSSPALKQKLRPTAPRSLVASTAPDLPPPILISNRPRSTTGHTALPGRKSTTAIEREPAATNLRSRLNNLLPRIQAANAELEVERQQGTLGRRDIETLDEGKGNGYVEMELGLGALEKKKRGVLKIKQEESEEESEEEEEEKEVRIKFEEALPPLMPVHRRSGRRSGGKGVGIEVVKEEEA